MSRGVEEWMFGVGEAWIAWVAGRAARLRLMVPPPPATNWQQPCSSVSASTWGSSSSIQDYPGLFLLTESRVHQYQASSPSYSLLAQLVLLVLLGRVPTSTSIEVQSETLVPVSCLLSCNLLHFFEHLSHTWFHHTSVIAPHDPAAGCKYNQLPAELQNNERNPLATPTTSNAPVPTL